MEKGTVEKVVIKVTDEEKARLQRVEARPPLSEILNLHDFEVRSSLAWVKHCLFDFYQSIARQVMKEKAWAYYSSAADDEITNRENHAAFHRSVVVFPGLYDLTKLVLGYGSDLGLCETLPTSITQQRF